MISKVVKCKMGHDNVYSILRNYKNRCIYLNNFCKDMYETINSD